MRQGGFDSPACIDSLGNAPYSSSLASSASASSASVWSDAGSQHSDDTSVSSLASEPDPCDLYCLSRQQPSAGNNVKPSSLCTRPQPAQPPLQLATDLRRNPRRTSMSRSARPPTLVRQCDRKVNFVDNLVDSSTQIVEAIWPTSSVACRAESGNSGVLPLRTFIQETLRRSRTSYSTLQVALYYLVLIKPHVPAHDFTMEQPQDCAAGRALQCGRRMFLAALILASKYLQDRNYSARAWSKISGLNTLEINQNEMAFVMAVNWRLHITDDVYNRWTDCVMRHTPTQPPSPGAGIQMRLYERQCDEFRRIILNLTPALDNLDHLVPCSPESSYASPSPLPPSPSSAAVSPRSLLASERLCLASPFDGDVTPTQKAFGTPTVMEPALTHAALTPSRPVPVAQGLLPTPRLTPQTSGFSTPAASCLSQLPSSARNAMSLAVAHAASSGATQYLDRFPPSTTPSPQSYFARRSSLAMTVSTASSPESMVSDSSRTSRSSSISSASSLVSAPFIKLDVQARCRSAKLCGDRMAGGLRPVIASVPEDFEEDRITASPDSYTAPVSKELCDLSLGTPLAGRRACDSVSDAARALQELHNYRHPEQQQQRPAPAPRTGSKRSRATSVDDVLQDNVRDMLAGRYGSSASAWPGTMVRPPLAVSAPYQQVPVRATSFQDGRKRLCCSSEAAQPSLYPVMTGRYQGPGMWEGLLD